MPTANEIEESSRLQLDFGKLKQVCQTGIDVLPVVVQDARSAEVLLIAYVNREALRLSLEEKRAVFYSTSRGEIWRKGETSGDVLALKEVRVNCEQNSLLFLVEKTGRGSCHTKDAQGKSRSNCYYRKLLGNESLILLEP